MKTDHNKATIILVALLVLSISFMWLIPASANTQTTVRHFTLIYVGVTYNDDGTSTWTYQLSQDREGRDYPALSHFSIELGECAMGVSAPSLGYKVVVGPDKKADFDNAIKWDDIESFPVGTPVTFSFTLNGHLQESQVQFSAKAGTDYNIGTITGPSTTCVVTTTSTTTEPPTTTTTEPSNTSTTTGAPTTTSTTTEPSTTSTTTEPPTTSTTVQSTSTTTEPPSTTSTTTEPPTTSTTTEPSTTSTTVQSTSATTEAPSTTSTTTEPSTTSTTVPPSTTSTTPPSSNPPGGGGSPGTPPSSPTTTPPSTVVLPTVVAPGQSSTSVVVAGETARPTVLSQTVTRTVLPYTGGGLSIFVALVMLLVGSLMYVSGRRNKPSDG